MNQQEIEDKYNALASALKLDKHTLEKRVQLLQHQRDQSEESIQRELAAVQQCLVVSYCKSGNFRAQLFFCDLPIFNCFACF